MSWYENKTILNNYHEKQLKRMYHGIDLSFFEIKSMELRYIREKSIVFYREEQEKKSYHGTEKY